MGRFAELKVSIMRLAAEVRKTIRKVNALEKIAIPDLDGIRALYTEQAGGERAGHVRPHEAGQEQAYGRTNGGAEGMTRPIRKILVYVDGTEQSITAAQYAIVLAKSLGAELFALYVVNTRALNELVKARIFLESEQEEYHRDLDEDAERYLNHVRDLARSKGMAVTAESVERRRASRDHEQGEGARDRPAGAGRALADTQPAGRALQRDRAGHAERRLLGAHRQERGARRRAFRFACLNR